MTGISSESLRSVLAALDDAATEAGADVLRCEAKHRVAVSRAVIHGDHDGADKSETALAIARAAFHRAVEKREEARQLLTQAVRTERKAFEDQARTAISAQLDELVALAASVDEDYAALVTKARRIKALETAIHADVRRDLGRSPWHAPMAYSALRPIASSLVTMANGVEPDIKPHVSTVIESARKNVEGAFRE